ncbi:Hypothetical predicted protein [Octopus vulgaris]|uniref:Uncharacterized protein n=1 Tax=Octopus vulgaris TaxID=6645 RepID=A0AA36BAA1_OCTVU|nr:Hypothetical predicted protein [Octopus vulgaris]
MQKQTMTISGRYWVISGISVIFCRYRPVINTTSKRAPVFSNDDSEYQRRMLPKPPPVVQLPKERVSQPRMSSPEPSRYPQPTDIHYTPKERSANVAPPNLLGKSEQLLHEAPGALKQGSTSLLNRYHNSHF